MFLIFIVNGKHVLFVCGVYEISIEKEKLGKVIIFIASVLILWHYKFRINAIKTWSIIESPICEDICSVLGLVTELV